MSQHEVDLTLSTLGGTANFLSQNYSTVPSGLISHAVELELVTAITLPGGVTHENPDHSAQVCILEFDSTERERKITLASAKALRLVDAFRQLWPGHETDCHDFMTTIEDWEVNRGGLDCSQEPLLEDEDIEAGVPYAVIAQIGSDDSAVLRRTHSCLATNDGQLLSVLGVGSMLTVMGGRATREVYAGGGEGFLSQAFPPSHARRFPNRIVPTEFAPS